MSVSGFDTGHNKVQVPTMSEFAALTEAVLAKQTDLAATGGEPQDDADDLKVTGIYYIPATADNVPSAHDYVIVVCSIDDENTAVMQVAISTNGTYIYTRMYVNSYFTAWKRWAAYSYVNNTFPLVTSGTTLPDTASGKNGDIYYYIDNGTITKVYGKLNNVWMEVKPNATLDDLISRVTTLEDEVSDITPTVTKLNDEIPGYIKMQNLEKAFTSGYTELSYSDLGIEGKTLVAIMASPQFAGGSVASGFCYCTCQPANNKVYIYMKNGITSASVVDGTYKFTIIMVYT